MEMRFFFFTKLNLILGSKLGQQLS